MPALLSDILITGLPYALPFLGGWLVFRLLNRIDLTVDVSFTLGGAVVTVLLRAGGVPPLVALLVAAVAGAGAGLVTAALHLGLRVSVLLAGIVMWIGMYSVNLRIMDRPALSLTGLATVFPDVAGPTGDLLTITWLVLTVAVVATAVASWLRTEHGLALRVTGLNPRMARRFGVDDRRPVAVGLAVSNALAATGGALVAQVQGFAEVSMGTGVAIAGTAAVLIGELLVRTRASQVWRAVLGVLIGALAYRAVLVLALRVGLPATDLRLAIAATLVLALAAQRLLRRGSGFALSEEADRAGTA